MFRDGLFAGTRTLVTGGGTGLGRAMAQRLVGLGGDVELWGRRGGVVAEAAAAMTAAGPGRATARAVDIRDATAVRAAIDAAWDAGQPFTHLLNNAAGNFVSRTEDLSERGFRAIAEIVFHGTFHVTQAMGRRWIASGSPGTVLSIVVTWVWTGSPFVVPSAMSKAGIHAMTKSLAVEWGPKGIRLNCIAPGVIPTEGAAARLRPIDAPAPPSRNPMGRDGTPEDLADLAAFLLSPNAGWINGQTIALDGAEHLAQGASFKDYLGWGDADWAEARTRIQARTAADRAGRGAG